MNKKILGCLFLLGVMSIRGADTSSFALINGVFPNNTQDRSLGITVTYKSPKGLKKLAGYTLKECQLMVPLVGITDIHVTEYYVGVSVAYDHYEFTSEEKRKLSSGEVGLLVTKSSEEHKDKTKKLVFSFEKMKSVSQACRDGG